MGFYSKEDEEAEKKGKANAEGAGSAGVARPMPGMSDALSGESSHFVRNLRAYIPMEMIGGSVPYVPGMEDEAVWNAASQSCNTEKVHYTYTIEGGRCWYLACPSSSFASNPDTWCPIAAALPGNSEHWDKETVYLYEQDGGAVAMRWEEETSRMQLFVGASRTILPRIQSMDANFVTVNPEMADVCPWRMRALRSEQLSRATARMLLVSGILVNVFIMLFIIGQYVGTNMVNRNLGEVKKQSRDDSIEMMKSAANALQSDTIRHMVRIQELLDTLVKEQGTLLRYEVKKDGSLEWVALIPQALGPTTYKDDKGATIEIRANITALGRFKVDGIDPKDGRVRIIGTR